MSGNKGSLYLPSGRPVAPRYRGPALLRYIAAENGEEATPAATAGTDETDATVPIPPPPAEEVEPRENEPEVVLPATETAPARGDTKRPPREQEEATREVLLAQRRRPRGPYVEYSTGACGVVSMILMILLALLTIIYFGHLVFVGNPASSTIERVFFYWGGNGLLVLFGMLVVTASVLNFHQAPLIWVFAILLALIAVGTFGYTFDLLIDWLSANTRLAGGPGNPFNDPLYCCAYWDQVAACSGYGPCVPAVVPADLRTESAAMVKFFVVLAMLVCEVILLILFIFEGGIRRRKYLAHMQILREAQDAYFGKLPNALNEDEEPAATEEPVAPAVGGQLSWGGHIPLAPLRHRRPWGGATEESGWTPAALGRQLYRWGASAPSPAGTGRRAGELLSSFFDILDQSS